jgi:hypothetical protein
LGFVKESEAQPSEVKSQPKSKGEAVVEKSSTSSDRDAQLQEIKKMLIEISKEVKTIKKILNED